jgi:hypothetical protein
MAQQIKITQTSNADMNIGVQKTFTAVEWLFQEFFKVKWDSMQGNRPIIFEQAKAMEKEQINKAYANGANDRLHNRISEYYNETFNK